MTYPIELRENTYLTGSLYPINLFRNISPSGKAGRNVLCLHWHDHFELVYMVSGSAVFHIDSQPFDVLPGDLLMVSGGQLHTGFAAAEEPVEYWSLVFNRILLGEPKGDPIHERYLSPFLDGKLRFPARISGQPSELNAIRSIVHRIQSEFDRKSRAFELVVKAELLLLFTQLVRMYLPEHSAEAALPGNQRMERFKSLILHIQTHYHENLSVSEAARMVHLNPYYFCKVFKSATGRTFIDFVNRCRMDEAERLLQDHDLTITETAERVGCGNLNYFTRLFKQIKGMTPSEARKMRG